MILKTLYLKLDEREYDSDVAYPFLKRSRCLCNFIEREVLRELQYATEGFNRIVVSLCAKPSDDAFVNSSNVAVVEIPFQRYQGKSGRALSLYYIDRLKEGLNKCGRTLDIPKKEILKGIEAFVSGGMKNDWVHKERVFKKLGLRAVLHGSLDQEKFHLRLEVSHKEAPVFDAVILETDPDEIAYEHRFKDVVVEGSRLVVTSKRGKPLWQMPVSKLVK